MTKTYLLLLVLIIAQTIHAQQVPIDFENTSHTFTSFGKLSSTNNSFKIINSPLNTSNSVGQFKNDANNPNAWQGFFIDLQNAINLNTSKIITLDALKLDTNAHTITLKLERGGMQPDVEVAIPLNSGNNTSNIWFKNLQFDFSNAKKTSDNSIVNATGNYTRLTLFIDGGIANTPETTILIDNIIADTSNTTPVNPNALDVVYTDLVWSDDFNATTLDTNKWHRQTIGIVNGGWANGELQHYTNSNSNAYVANGNLHIVAKKETVVQNGVSRNYTSARLNSKFAFTYGRIDVRAKLPSGNGTWPAIWTLGKNITETGAYWQTQGFGTTPWPDCGEIDIMEHGLHQTNVVSSAIHNRSSFGATVNTSTKLLADVTTNYHIYSMNWSPNQITFLINNVPFYTYKPIQKNNQNWPFTADQFLILNVAMGGIAGNIDANFTQSSMVIDYVKIYQNTATAGLKNTFSNSFKIYPNPSNKTFKINTTIPIDHVSIYTSLGKKVKHVLVNNTNNINITQLAKGIYVIKIAADNKMAIKKLIVN